MKVRGWSQRSEVTELASKLQNVSEYLESLKVENSGLSSGIREAYNVQRRLENKISNL